MTASIDQLRKSNNELDHKLNPHNAAIMTDMVVYLRVGDLSDLQVEIIRQDLLDMALAAQERGEDISQVIGSDPKAFCDDILRNGIPRSGLEKAKDALSIVANSAAILLLIHLLFMKSTIRMFQNWFTGHPAEYAVPISAGLLFSIAILIAAVVHRSMDRQASIQTVSQSSTETKPPAISMGSFRRHCHSCLSVSRD